MKVEGNFIKICNKNFSVYDNGECDSVYDNGEYKSVFDNGECDSKNSMT